MLAPSSGMRDLLHALVALLPKRLYAHLSAEAVAALTDTYHVQPHGTHYKVGLMDMSRVATFHTSTVAVLTIADVHGAQALYRVSYPSGRRMAQAFWACQSGILVGRRAASALVGLSCMA